MMIFLVPFILQLVIATPLKKVTINYSLPNLTEILDKNLVSFKKTENNTHKLPMTMLSATTTTKCDEQLVLSCLSQWLYDSGLTGVTMPKDVADTIRANLLKEGKKGLVKLSRAVTRLRQCLPGPKGIEKCLSSLQFMRMGVDKWNAYSYEMLVNEIEFITGSGLIINLNNWDCIKIQEIAKNKTLQACEAEFNGKYFDEPEKECSHAKTYAECRGGVFEVCNQNTAWALCEEIRLGLNAIQPQCSYNCEIGNMIKGPSLIKTSVLNAFLNDSEKRQILDNKMVPILTK